MKRLNQDGFTLLELIASLVIVVMILSLTVSGLRLGITSRNLGEQRTDTFQRVRFIGEQLKTKIRSFHPLFIRENTEDKVANTQKKLNETRKYLAFEGTPSSVRFISFADVLSGTTDQPYMHEVEFYLGVHPETEEEGIIMMEREVSYDNIFTPPDPESPTTRFIMLAKEVSHMSFRYYKVSEFEPEPGVEQDKDAPQFAGTWVESISVKPVEALEEESPGKESPGKESTTKTGAGNSAGKEKEKVSETTPSGISMPRAVEISLGVNVPLPPGKSLEDVEEREEVYLPPFIVPLNTGIEFIRTTLEENEEGNEDI